MRATGIIRRIDDLGRIVLPKEIRKSLKIKEGDMLEIYVQDNEIISLKKYEPMDNLSKIADKYAEVIYEATGFNVCITTKTNILCSAGTNKKEYIKKDIDEKVEKILNERIKWSSKNDGVIPIIKGEDTNKYTSQLIMPIIDESDIVGSIIVFSIDSEKSITDYDSNIIKVIANLLVKQLN